MGFQGWFPSSKLGVGPKKKKSREANWRPKEHLLDGWTSKSFPTCQEQEQCWYMKWAWLSSNLQTKSGLSAEHAPSLEPVSNTVSKTLPAVRDFSSHGVWIGMVFLFSISNMQNLLPKPLWVAIHYRSIWCDWKGMLWWHILNIMSIYRVWSYILGMDGIESFLENHWSIWHFHWKRTREFNLKHKSVWNLLWIWRNQCYKHTGPQTVRTSSQ